MRLALLSLLLFAACRPPGISGTESELRVAPAALELEGWVSFAITGELELTNAANHAVDVTITGATDFELSTRTLRLAAAESARVVVSITMSEAGSSTSELSFTSGESQPVRVSLHAIAREPPTCTARACESVRFDPSRGACVSDPIADGADCESDDPCVIDGHCFAGRCEGAFRDCDDTNACTLDACSSLSGCLHREVQLPPSDDPCQVPSCGATGAIELGPAVDGTPCGPNDCSTARVCISGACATRTPPEGSRCADPTPCQGEGLCVSGACVRPSPTRLSAAWAFEAPPDGALSLLSTPSAQGELIVYAGHEHADPTDAGSTLWVLNADGGIQAEVPIPRASPYQTWRDVAGERVYLLLDNQFLEARRGDTGALLWSVDLVNRVLPLIPGSTREDWAISVLAGVVLPSSRDLALISRRWDWLDPGEPWLTIVSMVDGSVKRVFPVQPGGVINGLTGDAFDNIYVAINRRADPQVTRVASYTPLGTLRWSTLVTGANFLSALQVLRDRVYVTGSDQVFHFATGAPVFQLPVVLEVLPVQLQSGWAMAGRQAGELMIFGFDWQNSLLFGRHEPGLKPPLLASKKDAVLFYSGPSEAHVLIGLESSGREAFSCPLEDVRYLGFGALRSGERSFTLRERGPQLINGLVAHELNGW